MVYCMTETNLCPSRSEMWECSPNKRSAATLSQGDVTPRVMWYLGVMWRLEWCDNSLGSQGILGSLGINDSLGIHDNAPPLRPLVPRGWKLTQYLDQMAVLRRLTVATHWISNLLHPKELLRRRGDGIRRCLGASSPGLTTSSPAQFKLLSSTSKALLRIL
jgi:hypothetical protein